MSNLKAIHEAARLSPINKIMVVGHPLSGYASVEQVLHGSGLQAAAASKSQGLSPTQVSDMLLRAYRVQPLNELQTLDNFKPIDPSPVWQTLALDLLLGNLEQELWGWADPQAIYLLDYWKNLDHQLAFVLVYDSPQASLASLFDNPEVDCNEHVVKAASANWLVYNEALLNFYLGNTERCLLVHGQQVRAQTADCLRQVQHQMGVELKMLFADGLAGEVKQTGWNALQVELCARVISANPKVGQMYTDLQSVASLPMGNVTDKPSFDNDMAVLSKFVTLHRSNWKIQQLVEDLKAAKEAQEQQYLVALDEERQQNMEELRRREAELQGRVNELAGQLQQARDQVNQQAAVSAADYVTSNKALEEENQMLLEELHKVQEELEQIDLNYKNIKLKLTQTEEKLSPRLYGAASLVKEDLPYRLGSAMVNCKPSLISYLTLPLKLLKIIRNFNNQDHSISKITNKIEDYADAYQAEKLKKHLSYKFGKVLLEAGSNPIRWLTLPIRLKATYRNWRLSRN